MSTIQAVLFNRNTVTLPQAVEWLARHRFVPIKNVHETDKFHRYRLKEPDPNKEERIKHINNDLSFIIEFPKNKGGMLRHVTLPQIKDAKFRAYKIEEQHKIIDDLPEFSQISGISIPELTNIFTYIFFPKYEDSMNNIERLPIPLLRQAKKLFTSLMYDDLRIPYMLKKINDVLKHFDD